MSRRSAAVNLQEYKSEDERIRWTTYELSRNTRPHSTPAGTRAVSVVVAMTAEALRTDEHQAREDAERYAREVAVDAWRNRWGGLCWDMVEINIAHLTVQVVLNLSEMKP